MTNNPGNQLTTAEHEQLHNNPPDIAYDELERLIRDWIMEHEGYTKLFLPILASNGITKDELALFEDPTSDDIKAIEEGGALADRFDEIHTLYKAAEDRAYLITIIKLYQLAIDYSPSEFIRSTTHPATP